MFIIAVAIMIILSIALSVLSLLNMQKHIKTEEIAKELSKGRVIFQASSSPESS